MKRITLEQLPSILGSLPPRPRVVASGNFATPHTVLNALDAAVPEYVLHMLNAQPGIPDREDGAEYLYTLFVPSDASTVFPCFDQPDLKARFTLNLTAPSDWKVIGNSPLIEAQVEGARLRHRFATSEPISFTLSPE